MDVLLAAVAAFGLGLAAALALVPRLRRARTVLASSEAPPPVRHKDLTTFAHVWYPQCGEWRSGRVSGPSESSRNYYDIWPTSRGDKVRVALLDLRLDTGEPLGEMCPTLSITEMEAETR